MTLSGASSANRPVRRIIAAAAMGATAALTLAACSPSHSGGQSGNSGGAGPGGGEAEAPKITRGEPFQHPTDLEVAGLEGQGQRIMSSTGSEARWTYLPGTGDQDGGPFNAALSSLVRDHLQAQAQSRDASYAPEAFDQLDPSILDRGCVAGSTARSAREILDDPNLSLPLDDKIQLTITCEPVLAAGTTFGERMRFVRGNATDVVSDFVEILYTNTETGETARGKELFGEAAPQVLYDALLDVLEIDPPMSGGEVVAPSAETLGDLKASLSNVGFADNGDIYVTVDQPFVAVIAAGDPQREAAATTLVIPAARASELLTGLGQAISAAKAGGMAWQGMPTISAGHSYVDCSLVPCVAVTYDDGPSYITTPTVLDAYAGREHAATTFFVLGQNLAGNEELVKRAISEGHEVDNHSWSHPAFTGLDDAGIQSQVGDTTALIEQITGVPVAFVRPPYGDMNERTLAATGLPSILWSVDTNDWQHPDGATLIQRAVWEAQPDGIILMHDIHEDTVAQAGAIADGLLQRGFTLVTLKQLFTGASLSSTYYWSAVGTR